jgi:hypothetical protein
VLDTFALYRRYPLLFLVLAATVIVPYEAIVLVASGVGQFEQSSLGAGVGLWLTLTDLALVGPLVSALHVHAVREVREGGDPKLIPIARQGLKVLPVVAAVSIVSWLGILAGFLALIVPGVYLMLRWFVVAQTAAIEGGGWLAALRRGADLTEGHYGHVFVFFIYITVIVTVPVLLGGLGFGDDSTTAASFLVGLAVQVLAYSFGALATALLYFDLRARRAAVAVPPPTVEGDAVQGPPPRGQSLDPEAEDRGSSGSAARPSPSPSAPDRGRDGQGGLAANFLVRRVGLAGVGGRRFGRVPAGGQGGRHLQQPGDDREAGGAALVAEAEHEGRDDQHRPQGQVGHPVHSQRNHPGQREAPVGHRAGDQHDHTDRDADRLGTVDVAEAEDPGGGDDHQCDQRLKCRVYVQRDWTTVHGKPSSWGLDSLGSSIRSLARLPGAFRRVVPGASAAGRRSGPTGDLPASPYPNQR